MQPQPMCQLRERLEEVASFSALMLSQTLVEEPCLTRMCYHHELSQASIERTVRPPCLTCRCPLHLPAMQRTHACMLAVRVSRHPASSVCRNAWSTRTCTPAGARGGAQRGVCLPVR